MKIFTDKLLNISFLSQIQNWKDTNFEVFHIEQVKLSFEETLRDRKQANIIEKTEP
jgi:hypothetical protein